MNIDTRNTIDLELGSNSVGNGTKTSTKAEAHIEDYPKEVDYDDLGCCNEIEDINDFDSGGSNKFDVCQDSEDAYETNMDKLQGFEFSDNVLKADFKSHNETLVMKTSSSMEMQMVEIYTQLSFQTYFNQIQEADEVVYRRAHIVTFRNTEEKATCSCHLYEQIGIPCSHMLSVFFLKNIIELRQHCIMKRWTKNVTKGISRNSRGVQVQPNCENTYSTRYNDLFRRCNILLVKHGYIDEACDKVAAIIDMEKASAIQAYSTHTSLAYTRSPCVTPILSVVSNPHVTIMAPIYVKQKGWPSPFKFETCT
ncbi:hypothetical protein AMTRI_Chr07g27120 [Amborella trichopoda]